jgi:hypothetical protein
VTARPPEGSGSAPGVDLPESHRKASVALVEVLREGARAVPALATAAEGLRRDALGETVLRFEATRSALPAGERLRAAQAIVRAAASLIQFAGPEGSAQPLSRSLETRAAPPRGETARLKHTSLGAARPLVPRVPWGGAVHEGAGLAALADALLDRHTISPAAAQALRWIAAQGAIELAGQRFVVMGAAAELAPTEVLLRAGAQVLYVDLAPAAKWLERTAPGSGAIAWPEPGSDLLADPASVLAAILAFAGDGPVHLGLFGYAGGANREWRLAAAMNAIVRALPPGQVASVGMYLSPSAPAQAMPAQAAVAIARARRPAIGERAWRAVGVLKPAIVEAGGRHWPRTVVAMQGASYLAAQYVEKRLAAEVFALRGTSVGAGPAGPDGTDHGGCVDGARGSPVPCRPIVSAQVAGMTRTASMDIPAFNAAFVGAEILGVDSYAPATTRWLSAMLYLESLLNPGSPSRPRGVDEAEDADRVHSVQVHGGLFAYPWATEGALARAAVVGLLHRPSLIPGVIAGARGRRPG